MKIKIFMMMIIFLNACTFGKKDLQNTAYLYQEKFPKINAEYQVFHNSSIESTLSCRIKSNEFLSVFSANEKQKKINLSINGQLYLDKEESIPLDSFANEINVSDSVKLITEEFTFRSKLNEKYLLKITLKDLSKSTTSIKKIYFEKGDDSKENFRVFKNGEQQYSNIFNVGDSLLIFHNSEKENLSVRFFNEDFDVAEPPFNIGRIKAAEIYPKNNFNITSDKEFFILHITQKGIYQITTNDQEKGLNILSFRKGFPTVSNTNDMIATLEYINTKEELQKLTTVQEKKIALDQFWLNKTKHDKKIAKKLIRTYYKRVENANKFFTSYKAGWKTDRGMIMIVFGTPNIIYESKDGESWIYGEKNTMYALNFTFTKIKNKFSENDFQLNRSAYFKNPWNTAKDSWRNGHPYSDIDIKERIHEQERRQKQNQFYFWY